MTTQEDEDDEPEPDCSLPAAVDAPSSTAAGTPHSPYSTISRRTSQLSESDPLVQLARSRPPRCIAAHGPFAPGSLWRGTQKSGRASYDVSVRFTHVDFATGSAAGQLRIRGLTPSLPLLTTAFDAEIVGGSGGHGFVTGKWDVSEDDDLRHWSRFPAFRALREELHGEQLTFDRPLDRSVVFMRWKERAVVPDPAADGRVPTTPSPSDDIAGASFEGHYYVVLAFNAAMNESPVFEEEGVGSSGSVGASSSSSSSPAMAATPPLSSPPRSPIMRRASSSTPFSYASIVRGMHSTSPPTSPISAHASLAPLLTPPPPKNDAAPNTSEAALDTSTTDITPGPSGTSPPRDGFFDHEAIAPTAALSPSEDDFPSAPLHSPRIGRPTTRRRASSATNGPIAGGGGSLSGIRSRTRDPSASRAIAASGYAGAFSQATLSGFYWHRQCEPFQELSLAYCGTGPHPDWAPTRRASACSTYTML